jgi:ribulose-phosphate 3-epimerase
VKSIKAVARLPLDVHLMISDPDRYIEAFADAGASMISVHVEVLPHLNRTLSFIRAHGIKAGAVLNPSTPVDALGEVAEHLDYVLVMSVNPGFGGQSFIPQSVDKIRRVRALLDRAGSRAPIEVDGGIDPSNVGRVAAAGAEIIVAGTAVFRTPDPAAAIHALRAAAGAPSPAAGSRA